MAGPPSRPITLLFGRLVAWSPAAWRSHSPPNSILHTLPGLAFDSKTAKLSLFHSAGCLVICAVFFTAHLGSRTVRDTPITVAVLDTAARGRRTLIVNSLASDNLNHEFLPSFLSSSRDDFSQPLSSCGSDTSDQPIATSFFATQGRSRSVTPRAVTAGQLHQPSPAQCLRLSSP